MAVAYLNDEAVVKEAQRRLQMYLPIDWEGNWYHAMDAWMALIGAAGMSTSIAALCREGQEAPSDNTLREKLDEQGWDERLIETEASPPTYPATTSWPKVFDSALGGGISQWSSTSTRSPFMAKYLRRIRT
jgi:hypothetical protein